MNYCYLSEKLNKTPEEIREMFSDPPAPYYDFKLGHFVENHKGHTSLRIKLKPNELHNLLFMDTLIAIKWDEYTNQMTQLSWEALSLYFCLPRDIVSVEHAAFLIDLAVRNCIQVAEPLREKILQWRSDTLIFHHSFALHKSFNRLTYQDNMNVEVMKALNTGFIRDAFVRV